MKKPSNVPEKKEQEIGYIKPREITTEMQESYIDYAMSVIVSRALPDVRDGLKPVHRRILYVMLEDGLRHDAKFRKSASVIGSCLSKYHPHGDMAVYDALVRMAQDFSLRYPLIAGQGNFGCFTKDTRIRLTDGRNLDFGKLITEQKQNKKHWTFTFNPQTKKIEIAKIKNPRLTRKDEKIIEVVLDNGEKIKCTLDHRFMLRSGEYKEAKDLKPGDSLMPFYTKSYNGEDKNLKGYEIIYQPIRKTWEFMHRLADEWNLSKGVYTKSAGRIRHHLDFNKLNNNPDNILRIQWQDHWHYHKEIASERHTNNPEYVKKIAEGRRKFIENNKELFSQRAKNLNKKLWANPDFRKRYSEQIKKRWQDPKFREKFVIGVISANRRRLDKNPNLMKELAQKAKISLHKNWKEPSYKEKVIKSKILGYVYSLLNKYSEVTPKIYQKERYNNCIPKIENALNYFDSFPKILTEAKRHNHKVVKTRILRKREDVYDLTIDPWHNFALASGVFVHNSIDGDGAAAYRYTEARLSKLGEEMLKDIEKNTVNFVDNYDGTHREPVVLPSPLPQLLLNGTLGIAVGMATSIPPHNLSEVIDAACHIMRHPEAKTEDLFKFIKGPDFPTGGQIYNQKEIITAYSQGKGPIIVRGKAEIIDSEKTRQIVITEIPYQVNKATLIEQFAKLVVDKKIDGIKDIRDESDREGMRIAIDLKTEAHPKKIINRLYKFSNLQKTFHLNMIALVDGIQPRTLGLAEAISFYIDHRKEVVYKRTKFELEKARERTHILEGLVIALVNIDRCIKIIKGSKSKDDARSNLMKSFKLSEIQANSILEIRLHQLAKMERERIEEELKNKLKEIKELTAILKSPKKIEDLVEKELLEYKEAFGDERRTKVYLQKLEEIAEEDIIPLESAIITITSGGYIKRINPKTYKIQKRGGKGILGMKTVQEDVVEHFIEAKTHDSLLFFTDSGKVFRIPAYEIPEAARVARGRGIFNFLEISSQEKVLSVIPLNKEDTENGIKYLVMATEQGVIKKTALDEFKNIRRSGLIAINLRKGDLLKNVCKTTGNDDIIIVTQKGQSIRFKEKDVREMGRTAGGIRGIRVKNNDKIVGLDVIKTQNSKLKTQNYLLVVTDQGYGKRTDLKEYRLQGRGGSGIKALNVTSKTGNLVVSRVLLGEEEELIVISQKGNVIKSKISLIPKLSRTTQGVRLMRLTDGDKVASAITT